MLLLLLRSPCWFDNDIGMKQFHPIRPLKVSFESLFEKESRYSLPQLTRRSSLHNLLSFFQRIPERFTPRIFPLGDQSTTSRIDPRFQVTLTDQLDQLSFEVRLRDPERRSHAREGD